MSLPPDEIKGRTETVHVLKGKNCPRPLLSYFDVNRGDFFLTWNDASQKDWETIKKFFIAAYFNAYKDCSIANDGGIALNPSWISKAKRIIDVTCKKARTQGVAIINNKIFSSLSNYFKNNDEPLNEERSAILNMINSKESSEAHRVAMERLAKYLALILYFETMFNEEKEKILAQHGNKRDCDIQYIVARYHEQPIGFISCNLNYKTSNVYLRWVNINPKFHRLHVGSKMLKDIEKHYNTNGLEVYTREHNTGSKHFYSQYGFYSQKSFYFDEPVRGNTKLKGDSIKPYVEQWLSGGHIFPPLDDATSRPDLNIGFVTKRSGRREI